MTDLTAQEVEREIALLMKPVSSLTSKYRKRLRKRQKADNLLHSWGAWKTDPVSARSPFQTIIEGEVYAEGHDHCLLTDFDSLMIEVDHAIEGLNKIDKRLIECQYLNEVSDPVLYWCHEFGREAKTFANRKSELLLKIAIKLKL